VGPCSVQSIVSLGLATIGALVMTSFMKTGACMIALGFMIHIGFCAFDNWGIQGLARVLIIPIACISILTYRERRSKPE
jgi:hypothetical protein